MKPIVLVTDGQWRKSLSAIRALGSAGYEVWVQGDSIFTSGFWSRWTRKRWISKSAAEDPQAFARFLEKVIQACPEIVIYPMEEASLEVCYQVQSATQGSSLKNRVKHLAPSFESFQIAKNKERTLKFASDLKIKVPQTFYFDSFVAFYRGLLSLNLNQAWVIKPCQGSGSSGILYLKELNSESFYQTHWNTYGALMIQERILAPSNEIKSEAIGVSLLFNFEHECVASSVHQRLQQYPNTGGPSTDRVSVKNDFLLNESIRLLKALRWVGVAMVEWKDSTLMEINPRYWGSLELSVRSGVNFPVLSYKILNHQNIQTICAQEGVRCRWFFPGEILRYWTQKSDQRESLCTLLKEYPYNTEEWDKNDIRGFIATYLCTVLLALKPKYWRYLRR